MWDLLVIRHGGGWFSLYCLTIYPLPATRYPLPATRYPLPATRYPLPNSFAGK